MNVIRCADCRFWRTVDHTDGRCEKHTPRVAIVEHRGPDSTWQEPWTLWPETSASDGCAEGLGHPKPPVYRDTLARQVGIR